MFLHAEAQLVFTLADHTIMMKWIIKHFGFQGLKKKAMQQTFFFFFGCWNIDFRFYSQQISPPSAALQLSMAVQKCIKKATEKGIKQNKYFDCEIRSISSIIIMIDALCLKKKRKKNALTFVIKVPVDFLFFLLQTPDFKWGGVV